MYKIQLSSQDVPNVKHSIWQFLRLAECEDGSGFCSRLLTAFSMFLILIFLPFSLFFVVKVVQEYERAVIFRLGRLLSGGARGPGVFFVIPCVDIYEKVDLRTNTYEIPPQEVGFRTLQEMSWNVF